jgi:hypothetical protein
VEAAAPGPALCRRVGLQIAEGRLAEGHPLALRLSAHPSPSEASGVPQIAASDANMVGVQCVAYQLRMTGEGFFFCLSPTTPTEGMCEPSKETATKVTIGSRVPRFSWMH